jgi:hypothetical protein
MEIIAPMWSSTSHNAGKLLHSCSAVRTSEGETTLQIHEYCLVDSASKKKSTMPFDFDLKFGFTLAPPTIYFEKQEDKVKYELKSEADLQTLRNILKGKLNQRGFHEQFKPKKKIGKGNFASVYLA